MHFWHFVWKVNFTVHRDIKTGSDLPLTVAIKSETH